MILAPSFMTGTNGQTDIRSHVVTIDVGSFRRCATLVSCSGSCIQTINGLAKIMASLRDGDLARSLTTGRSSEWILMGYACRRSRSDGMILAPSFMTGTNGQTDIRSHVVTIDVGSFRRYATLVSCSGSCIQTINGLAKIMASLRDALDEQST
jgi:succinate dehydrogenase/fumarate reductase-like Fe-S protein